MRACAGACARVHVRVHVRERARITCVRVRVSQEGHDGCFTLAFHSSATALRAVFTTATKYTLVRVCGM